SFIAYKNDLIHIRSVKVYLLIVFLAVVTRYEAFEWVLFHQTGLYRLFYLTEKLFYRTDTQFLTSILGTPDRQRSTPVTRPAKIPVHQVFKPLTKTTATGACRLPVDSIVQLYHPFAQGCSSDKPAVKWVVQYRLVSSPAMRITVNMLSYFKVSVLFLEHNRQIHIQGGIFICQPLIIGILDIAAGKLGVLLYIYTLSHKVGMQVLNPEETTVTVNHGLTLAILVDHQ